LNKKTDNEVDYGKKTMDWYMADIAAVAL